MPTYFSDAKYGTPKYVIFSDWCAGETKASCERRLISTFGSCDRDDLDRTWAALDAEFGPNGSMPLYPPRKYEVKLEDLTGVQRQYREAYLRWKGDIGMGAHLRQIVADQRDCA